MPPRASSAANTPLRTAMAVAHPFHVDSSPTRVWPNGTWDTAVMDMAWASCSAESPSAFPAAQAPAGPMNRPWSHPCSRVAKRAANWP